MPEGYKLVPGPSIIHNIEQMLDAAYDELQELLGQGWSREDPAVARLMGKCLGMATALSVAYNPYNPNLDEIRAACHARYEERVG